MTENGSASKIKKLDHGDRDHREMQNGRDDRIRTCGLFTPNEARYQAAPHPDQPIVTLNSRRNGGDFFPILLSPKGPNAKKLADEVLEAIPYDSSSLISLKQIEA